MHYVNALLCSTCAFAVHTAGAPPCGACDDLLLRSLLLSGATVFSNERTKEEFAVPIRIPSKVLDRCETVDLRQPIYALLCAVNRSNRELLLSNEALDIFALPERSAFLSNAWGVVSQRSRSFIRSRQDLDNRDDLHYSSSGLREPKGQMPRLCFTL